MKKFVQLVCSSALLLAASSVSAVELGVVQINKVLRDSKAGQELSVALRANDQKTQLAIQKLQQELQNVFRTRAEKAKQEFELQKDLLSSGQLKAEEQKLVQSLQAMQVSAEQELAGRRQQLARQSNQNQRTEQDKVLAKVRKIVDALAKERKFDLVLTESAVMSISNKALDITDLVVERLDKDKAAK